VIPSWKSSKHCLTKTQYIFPPESLIEAVSFADAHRAGPGRGEILATLHGELGTILNWTERQAIGKSTKNNTPERHRECWYRWLRG